MNFMISILHAYLFLLIHYWKSIALLFITVQFGIYNNIVFCVLTFLWMVYELHYAEQLNKKGVKLNDDTN